jgi:hypothetical protein
MRAGAWRVHPRCAMAGWAPARWSRDRALGEGSGRGRDQCQPMGATWGWRAGAGRRGCWAGCSGAGRACVAAVTFVRVLAAAAVQPGPEGDAPGQRGAGGRVWPARSWCTPRLRTGMRLLDHPPRHAQPWGEAASPAADAGGGFARARGLRLARRVRQRACAWSSSGGRVVALGARASQEDPAQGHDGDPQDSPPHSAQPAAGPRPQ